MFLFFWYNIWGEKNILEVRGKWDVNLIDGLMFGREVSVLVRVVSGLWEYMFGGLDVSI